MPSLTKLISLVAAASMTVSGALNAAAPQNDVNGLLFLANRQYMVSEAYSFIYQERKPNPHNDQQQRDHQSPNAKSPCGKHEQPPNTAQKEV